MAAPVLRLERLNVALEAPGVSRLVLRDVSLDIGPGETVGLVGESGSGKSMLSQAVTHLLPTPPARLVSGAMWFEGENLAQASEADMRRVRGCRIAMIFQDPMTALNPCLSIERQLTEVLEAHRPASRRIMRQQAIDVLEQVGIADAEQRMQAYPHAFSGGMRQRVMIAMAVLCAPALIIADEPTTALDVTVQAQVLDLLQALGARHGTAILLISHNLDVVASRAQRLAVMYAGRIVELAPAERLYRWPQHPYTRALLQCVPHLTAARPQRLHPIAPGNTHASKAPQRGCAFAPRCPRVQTVCTWHDPPLLPAEQATQAHAVACHNPLPQSTRAL